MTNDNIFSDEYRIVPATQPEKPTEPREATLLEYQLEEQVRQEVKIYGSGKPTREVIRAKIIND